MVLHRPVELAQYSGHLSGCELPTPKDNWPV